VIESTPRKPGEFYERAKLFGDLIDWPINTASADLIAQELTWI
jgi:hypothetical protein